MDYNSHQWNDWIFMQQQGGHEPAAHQTSSSASYSPYSTASEISSSHNSYPWTPGAAPFDGSSTAPWANVHASLAQNSTTIEPSNHPVAQQGAPLGFLGQYHVACYASGIICQFCMILHQFQESSWRQAHEMEPRDRNTGRSVLVALLEEVPDPKSGRTHKCRMCEARFARQDRAVTHIRHKHLDHRPYACHGRCGMTGCEQRFHSQENLSPHVNPKMVDCPYCEHKCLRQNLKRHIKRYHPKKLEAQPKPKS